jgi:hypothetical protein
MNKQKNEVGIPASIEAETEILAAPAALGTMAPKL